ncbi:glycopeptide antibiotics resistance protein [Pseudarthrobacter sp. W1I19]|uniref:VanZ family protein n=1 Tax=Pseudarthrobacter sp. W1I19 TaxID=3042288 RepID=UPI00277D2F54|nr:VanZ family protein [Pseudarthrobacter sp. W1I19]MDQ0922266.1 glycopeptide antibiotics resistance protein [Pseudarthrobacter sp. W1I19]
MVLIAMLGSLALIAYWPTPVDQPVHSQITSILNFLHRHGIPADFTYRFMEASANVALFVPFGLICTFAFPKWPWWGVGASGLLISGCMELGQLLFLYGRFASPTDLATNTAGTVVGAIIAVAVLKRRQLRTARTQTK